MRRLVLAFVAAIGGAAAGDAAAAAAPDALPAVRVQDLHYGDVLFHFYRMKISRRSRACSPTASGAGCRTTCPTRNSSRAACTSPSACTTRRASASRAC